MKNNLIELKLCTKCDAEKSLDLFGNDIRYKDGKRSWCKVCSNITSSKSRNREKANEVAKRYRQSKKGILNRQRNEKTEIGKERSKRYRDKKIKSGKLAEYCKQKYATDPHYRIRLLCASRIREMLKIQNVNKTQKTVELIGCSIQELKTHFESLFIKGMTWENQGEWHIDHKKPCSLFNLTDLDQQKICFHYTNLQPLWALDNIKKSNKF